jgi:lathosterol oxidase
MYVSCNKGQASFRCRVCRVFRRLTFYLPEQRGGYTAVDRTTKRKTTVDLNRPSAAEMDYVLALADNIILDKVYAALLPAHAFYPQPTNSSNVTFGSHRADYWLSLVAHLPHPSPQSFLYASALPPAYETPNFLRTFESPPSTLSAWPRTYIPRQLLSLSIVTLIGIHVLYFLFAGLSYYFIFNHEMMKHPRFLKNQIRKEILCSLKAFPGMTILTLPFFQGEVMGFSKLYDDPKKYGYGYMVFSACL